MLGVGEACYSSPSLQQKCINEIQANKKKNEGQLTVAKKSDSSSKEGVMIASSSSSSSGRSSSRTSDNSSSSICSRL